MHFVQVCRGIAAMAIVLYHGRAFCSHGDVYEIALRGFDAGVDLFFVLSGLVMVLATKNSTGGAKNSIEFIIKRWARVWPPYAVATILFVSIATIFDHNFMLAPEKINTLIKSFLFYPLNTDSAPALGYPTLGVGWTLNYEMYFYALFAISLLSKRFRWVTFFSLIFLTLIIIPESTRTLSFSSSTQYNFSIGYLNLITSPIIWDFVCGVIIGLIYFSPIRIKNNYILNMTTYLSVALVLWLFSFNSFGDHGVMGKLPIIAFMVLSLTLRQKEHEQKSPKVLLWLGDISYSIYLTHTLLYAFVWVILQRNGFANISQGLVVAWLATILSIPAASIFHHYIEVKLSNIVRNKLLEFSIPKFTSRHAAFIEKQ
ncbi:acyltransferase family protein [Leclercia sp.]|uniref:acyltransferase family protein n=1 Tax=Leclercia sp. TaxID=1898428 RepID=UPI002FDEC2D7